MALAAVAEARLDLPGLRLTVVGVAPGEPIDGVEWLGVLPPSAMSDVYQNADLLLFPTRNESFGMVVIEAMAAGLPVIVSDDISVHPGNMAVAAPSSAVMTRPTTRRRCGDWPIPGSGPRSAP